MAAQPKLSQFFPEKFGGSVTADEIYRAQNVVKAGGLIRVEADEVRAFGGLGGWWSQVMGHTKNLVRK